MKRGDVVVADIAFSDRQGSKVRPCIVVSADVNNAAIQDVILVAVSRSTRAGALTHLMIDPATSDGKIAGLLHRFYVQCENIFTLDKKFVLNTIDVPEAGARTAVATRFRGAEPTASEPTGLSSYVVARDQSLRVACGAAWLRCRRVRRHGRLAGR